MNQAKRRLTGVLATTTLLAAAGAGVVQLTHSDLLSSAKGVIGVPDERPLRREDTVKKVTNEVPTSERKSHSLDVMANAWAQQQAHPAEETATKIVSQPIATDMVPVAAPQATGTSHKPSGDRYAQLANESQPFAEFNPVTLGQEPNAREQAYGSTTGTNDAKATGQAAQLRARNAFGDRLASPNGRYTPSSNTASNTAINTATNPPTNQANQQFEETQANPFARQPAPINSQTRQAQPLTNTPLREMSTASTVMQNSPRYERRAMTASEAPTAEISPVATTPAPQPFATQTPVAAPSGLASPQSSNQSSNLGATTPAPASPRVARNIRPLELEPATPLEPDPTWNNELSQSAADTAYGKTSPAEGTGRPGEQALEGPQKPAIVIRKIAPSEIQVGKAATFGIEIRNTGDRPANDVVVRDAIPQGTKVISSTPKAKMVAGELVWQIGTMSIGEVRKLEVELMPITEGEIGSVAAVTYSAQASVKTRCTLPQLALRLTAPRKVMIGTEQHVKIEIHNPGTGDATGVMLLENVPEELKHVGGPALEFEVGTLRAGETREMELILTAEKPGIINNRITARAEGNLQVEQELEFEVIAPALEVGVAGPRVRYLERPATYTVTVGNPGTATARDIELVAKLPKGMQFVKANNMGEYDTEQHAVFWSLAELPEGESGKVEVIALPIASGEQEINVEGTARQGLEDQTSQPVLVEGLAAITFEVVDLQDPIEIGGDTTYEIRIVNQGSKAATGVQVTVILPPGMKVISADGETRHSIQQGGVIFEPLSSLAAKADTVYQLQVQGIRAGEQRVVVEVDTEDIGQPIRKEESTRVFSDE